MSNDHVPTPESGHERAGVEASGADAHGHDDHEHAGGLTGLLQGFFAPHSHDAADSVDRALESSEKGIRAVKISLVALLVTSGL
nr:cation transporter [Chloroflexota bacterium]